MKVVLKAEITEETNCIIDHRCRRFSNKSITLNHACSTIIKHTQNDVKNFEKLHLREVCRNFADLAEDVFRWLLVNLCKIFQTAFRNEACKLLQDSAAFANDNLIFSLQQQCRSHQQESVRVTQRPFNGICFRYQLRKEFFRFDKIKEILKTYDECAS